MLLLIFNAVAVVFYLLAVWMQLMTLASKLSSPKVCFLTTGLIALVTHAWLLHHWTDVSMGQNLTFLNMLSLVLWLIGLLILLTAIRRPVENLAIFIFPLCAISILLVWLFPAHDVINTAANPKQLVHILLSTLTFSMLCVAGLQAMLMTFQEYYLRHRIASRWMQKLPALETMEILLFQMIGVGFLLLTIDIALSIYFFRALFLHIALHKTILVVFAWMIFAVLLVGRYCFGWRGKKAIYYTLAGVFILIVAYFGNRILMEFLF